jgi:hypothetical protein
MSKPLKLVVVALLLIVTSVMSGCYAYSGVASPSENTVVVTRNSAFLTFIFPREVFVCQVTAKGLSQCSSNESP